MRTLPVWLLFVFTLGLGCDAEDPSDTSMGTGVPIGLIWSDEFDYTGSPDADKWDYDLGGGGWGNNELQFYTNRQNNVSVDGDHLVISALAEDLGGFSYTSARLVSRGKASFKYGRIEVRALLPSGVGTWPAIWMLPEDWAYGGWPNSGEIDIVEHVGKDQGRVHTTLHMGALNWNQGNVTTGDIVLNDVSSAFHVYGLEWGPDAISFTIDGQTVDIATPEFPNSGSYRNPGQGPDYWPFDQKFHLLFNIAIGGNWGGPDVDPGAFPATMLIDYVRVYELDD